MDNKNILYNLPKSWIWTTLGELGIVVSGGTPSTDEPQFWGDEIPWVTPADLSNYKDKYISGGSRNITKEGLMSSSAKLLPQGSILFSSRAPIGYVAIAKNELATNQGFKNLVLTESLYSDYIYYYLKSIKHIAEDLASGTTFLELSGSKFSNIYIPLPSISEQYKIVSRIEELNSALDDSEKSLLKVVKHLKIYRQALLKSAFNGKVKSKISGAWKSSSLGEVYNFIGGGTPSKKDPSYWNGDIKWASVKDIQEPYLRETSDSITDKGLKNSSTKIASVDDIILISRINPGKVAIARSEIAINQDLKIVRPLRSSECLVLICVYITM